MLQNDYPYITSVKVPGSNKLWRAFFALKVPQVENVYTKESSSYDNIGLMRQINQQHINLINIFYQPSKIHSVELRFLLMRPGKNKVYQNVDILIIISAEADTEEKALQKAQENYKDLLPVIQNSFKLYDVISIEDELVFKSYFSLPMKFKHLYEIRRRVNRYSHKSIIPRSKWELIPGKESKITEKDEDPPSLYIVHPFMQVYSPFEKLFDLLSRSVETVLVSIRVSPTIMQKEENQYFLNSIKECEDISRHNYLNSKLNREQAEILAKVLLSNYLSLQDAPFLMQIIVASSIINLALVDLLGTEITRPVGGINFEIPGEILDLIAGYSGGYDIKSCTQPKQKNELIQNLMFHENNFLKSNLAKDDSERRMQLLFDATEASCAFHYQ